MTHLFIKEFFGDVIQIKSTKSYNILKKLLLQDIQQVEYWVGFPQFAGT